MQILSLGAGILSTQLEALPPPPSVICEHVRFGKLQAGDAATLERLSVLSGIDDAARPTEPLMCDNVQIHLPPAHGPATTNTRPPPSPAAGLTMSSAATSSATERAPSSSASTSSARARA
mgnify:CR=1 FL=1